MDSRKYWRWWLCFPQNGNLAKNWWKISLDTIFCFFDIFLEKKGQIHSNFNLIKEIFYARSFFRPIVIIKYSQWAWGWGAGNYVRIYPLYGSALVL